LIIKLPVAFAHKIPKMKKLAELQGLHLRNGQLSFSLGTVDMNFGNSSTQGGRSESGTSVPGYLSVVHQQQRNSLSSNLAGYRRSDSQASLTVNTARRSWMSGADQGQPSSGFSGGLRASRSSLHLMFQERLKMPALAKTSETMDSYFVFFDAFLGEQGMACCYVLNSNEVQKSLNSCT
jgi:hypothetical protein